MKSEQIQKQVVQTIRLAIARHIGQLRARHSVDTMGDAMVAMYSMTLESLTAVTRYTDEERSEAGHTLAALAGRVLVEELAASGLMGDRSEEFEILKRAVGFLSYRFGRSPWPRFDTAESPDVTSAGLAVCSRLDQTTAKILFRWAGRPPELDQAMSLETIVLLFGDRPVLSREELGQRRRAEMDRWKAITCKSVAVTKEDFYRKSGTTSSTFHDRWYGADPKMEMWADDSPEGRRIRELLEQPPDFWVTDGLPVGFAVARRK